MNAILGAGIVGLPFALSNLGYVNFIIALVLVTFFTIFGIDCLLQLCDLHHTQSYEILAEKAFKLPGKIYCASVIYFHTMFAMCGFMIMVLNEGPPIVQGMLGINADCDTVINDKQAWYLNGRYLVVIVMGAVILPLCTLKNINLLGYTSGLAMLSMILFSVVIVIYKFVITCPVRAYEGAQGFFENFQNVSEDSRCEIDQVFDANTIEFYEKSENQTCNADAFIVNANSAYAIPNMLFAFQCHASSMPIYAELKNKTRSNMLKIAVSAVGAVFSMYVRTSQQKFSAF